MTRLSSVFVLALTISLIISVPANAQSDRTDALRNSFEANYEGDVQIAWNEKTNRPHAVFGFKSERIKGANTDEGKARLFLSRHANLLEIDSNLEDLEFTRSKTTFDGRSIVSFKQMYKGLPVYGSEYKVALDPEGRVYFVGGNYEKDIKPFLNPTLPKEQALSRAGREIQGENIWLREISPEKEDLVIYPSDNSTTLAYRIVFDKGIAIADANTGKVLEYALGKEAASAAIQFERQAYTKNTTAPSVSATFMPFIQGYGYIYPTNPGQGAYTSGSFNVYGGFLDNANVSTGHVDLGDPTPAKIALNNFQYTPGSGGSACTSAPSPGPPGWDCSHLGAVNTFYHANKFIDQFLHNINLGSPGHTMSQKVEIDVHGRSGSVADSTYKIEMGYGSDGSSKDQSKENEIIYHEVAHLVAKDVGYDIWSSSNEEAWGVGEAWSDYLASSYNNDPFYMDWVFECPPLPPQCDEGTNGTEYRRFDTDPQTWKWSNKSSLEHGKCLIEKGDGIGCNTLYYTYEAPSFSRYLYSMIFNGALWDIRSSSLGSSYTDFLVYNGMYYVPSTQATFLDLIVGILADAQYFFGSSTHNLVKSKFEARDFPTSTGGGGSKQNIEQSAPLIEEFTLLENYPNPFSTDTHIQYSLKEAGDISIRIYDMQGRIVEHLAHREHRQAGTYHVTWDAEDQPSGIYFVKLESASRIATRKIVVLK